MRKELVGEEEIGCLGNSWQMREALVGDEGYVSL